VKKGKRRNRLQTHQIFQCTECLSRFTAAPAKNSTYPLRTILEAVSTFNLGYSLTETQQLIRKRFHWQIPERTLGAWITRYRPLTTYARIRNAGRKLFTPQTIVHSVDFNHQQVYRHQTHRAKLELLRMPTNHPLKQMTDYLADLQRQFPHQLFQSSEHRSSKFSANLQPPIIRKENHATSAAALVIPTSLNNKKRHETLQRFMLVNDSVTVAVEIPVFLTKEDLEYYRGLGFALDFESSVITGHIDFLQIRNGHFHILDYKPEARKPTHMCNLQSTHLPSRAGPSFRSRLSSAVGLMKKIISSSTRSEVCTL
jgi:ATP-dependent exoDNAse (exonuclease V) beta subunit